MKFAISIILLLSFVIIQILKKKEIISVKKATYFSIFLIVLFLEFTLFNINSYRMEFSKLLKKEYVNENLEQVVSKTDEGHLLITLENLNLEVKTLYIELENMEKSETIDYEVFYRDSTTLGRSLITKTYNDFVPKTKYIATHFSGEAKTIDIKIYGQDVNISKVAINADIPFEFNCVRVISLIVISLLAYSICTGSFWKETYSIKNLHQNLLILFIIDIAIVIIYFFNTYCSATAEPVLDLYNEKLVRALSNKSVSLMDEPKEELLNLENPYDLTQRNMNLQRDEDYIWDAALYNGKYYVYFGILPALILFLPYYLITGKFLATATGVLLFSELSVVLIAILAKEIIKKYFPKIPFYFMFFSLIMVMFGTMLIWINVAPRFYELVTVAGLFFALLGFLLIFTAEKKDGYDNFKRVDRTDEENELNKEFNFVKVSYIKIMLRLFKFSIGSSL